VAYAKIFATGSFMSACRRWNEKEAAYKTRTNFKIHVAATHHHQHKQVQGKYDANSGYHDANADVGQTDDQMAETTIGALANLATVTSTSTYRGVVATLTEVNALLARQLEERSKEVKEVTSLLKKGRTE
jgi:hypothetical protein